MTISHNLIYDNSAFDCGGGIDVFCSTVTLNNNTIVQNYTTNNYYGGGGGVFVVEGTAQGDNNIIYGNHSLHDPDVSGNANFDYTCCPVPLPGIGNITDDPLFADTSANDFHLTAHSPCIDAGNPASPLDPDSTRADMGALYFDQSSGVDDKPYNTIPAANSLQQPYPNPFNTCAALSFKLQAASNVTLAVYDISGREAAVLAQGFYPAGTHQMVWDASEVASGVYFVQLSMKNIVLTRKLLLIK